MLGLAPLAAAQQKTPAQRFAELRENLVKEVTEQLRSDDLATVAWGAHAIVEFRLEQCLPELRARLKTLARADRKQREFAALVLLDTVVRMDAVVPGDELQPFLTGRSAATALVLLGRRASANRKVLLQAFRVLDSTTWEWQVCGNLLAQVLDREFALELLRRPIEVQATVTAPDGEKAERELALPGSSFLTSLVRVPEGYPPIATYEFREGNLASAPLLARGPMSVFARRTTLGPGSTDCESPQDADEVRRAIATAHSLWVAQMLGPNAKVPHFAFGRDVDHAWSSAEAYLAAMRELRTSIASEHEALVAACVEQKLFPEEDARALVPTVNVRAVDSRTDTSVPIPDANAAPRAK